MKSSWVNDANTATTESLVVRKVLPDLTQTMISLVERVLPWFEEKFKTIQKGMREYSFFCVTLAMVKTKLKPDSRDAYQKEAVDRITAICHGTLACDASRTKHSNTDKHLVFPSWAKASYDFAVTNLADSPYFPLQRGSGRHDPS